MTSSAETAATNTAATNSAATNSAATNSAATNSAATNSAATQTPAGEEAPPFRYSAALAAQIEARWQDRWEAEGTFNAPNPTGPLAPADGAPVPQDKLYLLDMFPYPSGKGLHVGHPLGYIGTDVHGPVHADDRPQRAAHHRV